MSDDVARSLRLNRNLAKNIPQSIATERTLKVGWGAGGDPKPKEGEVGIGPHLPAGAKIRLLGNLGDFTALGAEAGVFSLEGNALGWFGAWNRGARIIAERDVAGHVGHGASGGRVFVGGNAGPAAASHLAGGEVVIRGHADVCAGQGMRDGWLIIVGDAKADAGQGMTGGKIVVDGRLLPIGQGAKQRTITAAEHKSVAAILDEHGLSISTDAIVIQADGSAQTASEAPAHSLNDDFEGIGLIPLDDRIDASQPMDTVLLLTRGEADEGIALPLPVLPRAASGSGLAGEWLDGQPCLVDAKPRAIDFLRVHAENITDCAADLAKAAGMVLDLAALPALHDGEATALLTAMRTHLAEDAPLILAGRADRVEALHRLAASTGVDGLILHAATPAGLGAPALLPRIGLSARDHGLGEMLQALEVPWTASGRDLCIATAAGCSVLVCDVIAGMESAPSTAKARAAAIEAWLAATHAETRGILADLGIAELERLNRRHLRALDHDTAAQSGLRLAGYDRPLPFWVGQ